MKKMLTLVIPAAILMSSCASISTTKAPSASLTNLNTFYVQKLPADERGIERVISDQLNLLGYKSTYGKMATPSNPVDAIVTYRDKWMWDLTMYMLQLNLEIRDGKDMHYGLVGFGREESLKPVWFKRQIRLLSAFSIKIVTEYIMFKY